jgi:hypothetical protein
MNFMEMKKIILTIALAGLVSSPVFADGIKLNDGISDGIGLGGSPKGGYHIININGVECKLLSSAKVGSSASEGCNYIVTIPGIGNDGNLDKGPITVKSVQDNGCSNKCE